MKRPGSPEASDNLTEHDLARAASQQLPRAGVALQKLLGIGFDGNRPSRERAKLWRELADVARDLAQLADRFEQQANRLDYIDLEAATNEQRALPGTSRAEKHDR